jgi:hypothetical protein
MEIMFTKACDNKVLFCCKKHRKITQCWWVTLVILASLEAEITRITVQGHL